MRKEDLLTVHKALEILQNVCTNSLVCGKCDLAVKLNDCYHCSLDHVPAKYDDAIKLIEYKYNKLYSASPYDEITNEDYNKDELINDLVYAVSELVKERDKNNMILESWVIELLEDIKKSADKSENFDLHLEADAAKDIAQAYDEARWIGIY